MLNAPLARRGLYLSTRSIRRKETGKTRVGLRFEGGIRLVTVRGERVEVRKYVVLPVDADHFVEQALEFRWRKRGAEASDTARDV
jgi:hypothetical protein